MAVLRVRKTRPQTILESATPDEMPPLFVNNVTTRSLAILYHHGAMSYPLLGQVRPAMRIKDIMIGFEPLLEAGILVKHKVLAINGQPVMYALNQKHGGYTQTRYLLKMLWNFVEPRLTFVPTTPFRAFKDLHYETDGAIEIYSFKGRLGSVLHFLAEFDVPVEMKALVELLNFPYNHLRLIVNRLIAFGIVREYQAMDEKYFKINQAHPLGTPLLNWMRYANKVQFTRYKDLAELYTRQKINGELDKAYRAWSRRHNRFVVKLLPKIAKTAERSKTELSD